MPPKHRGIETMRFRRRIKWSSYIKASCGVALVLLLLGYGPYENGGCLRGWGLRLRRNDASFENILNSTLGFEKIFVLNLPARTDRRDALTLAAGLSDIKLDWVDGVAGDDVHEAALPPGDRINLSSGGKGSWRAHMNAIRSIVEQNLSSALILEDDIDWDIRLKSQLQTFAYASQMLLSRPNSIANPSPTDTKLSKDKKENARVKSYVLKSSTWASPTKSSPYGDDWDILWLGHCGIAFRTTEPLARILIPSDPTVPQPHHLKPHPFAYPDIIGSLYPNHTRVVHHPSGPSCSLAYALTQTGARKLLYEFGVKAFDKQFDFMLEDFCNNVEEIDGTRSGIGRAESKGVCVTVQPPIFSHHWPEGGSSDIYETGGGYVRMIGTLYVRLSTRLNLAKLIRGERELVDQWPDEGFRVES